MKYINSSEIKLQLKFTGYERVPKMLYIRCLFAEMRQSEIFQVGLSGSPCCDNWDIPEKQKAIYNGEPCSGNAM